MRIKNPLSSTQPPNALVYMKPAFEAKEPGVFIQTNSIKANSYPTWNYRSPNITMPLTAANQEWLDNGGNLEFEVFHKAQTTRDDNLEVSESNHLVGVAFVPLKPLVEGRGKTRLTGLYDVVSKGNIYQSMQSLQSLKAYEASFGKIKVCVSANINIKRALEGEDQTSTLPLGADF
mmetsp:Transcript_34710/g.53249  ORF Transcript_34710/g.53249 Transcript_34710/m.53249 type:complete len:176 (+) Transcript_34710:7066-7593(+)